MIYVIDGTYTGLLTCVFEAFERKEFDVQIETTDTHQPNIFIPERLIDSDISKFERIITGIKKKLGNKQLPLFYQAYLSEDIQAWNCIFYLLIELFKGQTTILENFGDDKVLYFHQTLKKVSRERHSMKAFIRFSKAADGLFFAIIEPDFNVLPLIIKFFKDRYADQPWLIYDIKREYGIHYDLQQINEVTLQSSEQKELTEGAITMALDERDALFQQLWKRYFTSTNIVARKNMKLHLQHVPKRYWKYLVEKQ